MILHDPSFASKGPNITYHKSAAAGSLSSASKASMVNMYNVRQHQINRNATFRGGGDTPAPYSPPSTGPPMGPHTTNSIMFNVATAIRQSHQQTEFDNVGNHSTNDAVVKGGAKYKKSKKHKKSKKSKKSKK